MAKLSPMMQQYFEIKEKYQDAILFFRLGDFYEMFYEDAITCSKELELTLTGKDCGQEERAPMCGVPFHAAEQYVDKLIEKGYRVAICEQIEDPSAAKGIVKRGVIRVVTAGTVTNSKLLDEKNNNYLCSVCCGGDLVGMAFADITTGALYATQIACNKGDVISELSRYNPSEIICNRKFIENASLVSFISERLGCSAQAEDDYVFADDFVAEKLKNQFGDNVEDIPESGFEYAVSAIGAMLEYLSKTQMCELPQIKTIDFYTAEQYMDIDFSSKRNLEITATMRDGKRRGSLLWVLDDTKTSMGARLLKAWIDKPLLNIASINNRLNGVDELLKSTIVRSEIREGLSKIQDIERLISRVLTGSANCRDLLALKASFEPLPEIIESAQNLTSALNRSVTENIDSMQDICKLLDMAIIENPPITIKEGGIIREGYDENVDLYRKAMTEGKQWLATIEQQEKEKTGIKNLKIGFNKVFGYYIEVSKSNIGLVPDTYIRKQTLTTGERYITGELKEIENSILGAEERICALEYSIFCEIRDKVANANERILQTAKALAQLDVLCSLAEVAVKNNYTMPIVNMSDKIDIKDGRHPVVERVLKGQLFIPNDTFLSPAHRVSIITGPNMAGKSTYMRQVALIVLMAQIGSFVPASGAEIGIVDKIFTRVGASDDLASGQSTFMVEMNEVANILDNATKNSLLILDEIGRGTSTYDGLSIAWAVVEYIADLKKLGAKTLFATHYHELTELEDKLDGVKNYCIAVKKRGDDIIFLRKIIQGGADESYGIEVAKLAGVKNDVIVRAKEIVEKLSVINTDITQSMPEKTLVEDAQLGFNTFGGQEIISKLQKMDVTTLTPIEALNKLYELKTEADKV